MRYNRGAAAAVLLAILLFGGMSAALPAGAQQAVNNVTLSLVPPSLPADGKTFSTVVVSLTTPEGGPLTAANATTVFLSSSNPGIAVPQSSVTIPPGSYYAVANVTTTTTAGYVTVTASSPGYTGSSAQLTVSAIEGLPTHLDLVPVPSSVYAFAQGGKKEMGNVFVMLLDDNGIPAPAAKPTTITLTEASSGVISVPASATIPSGQSFTMVSYQAGYLLGAVQVTASAAGLASSSATISAIGPVASQIGLYAEPVVAASSQSPMTVELLDQTGSPAIAQSAVTISFSSSNTTVATVVPSLAVPPGVDSAALPLNTASPGTATITASAPGFQSASFSVTVASAGSKPTAFQIVVPPMLSGVNPYNVFVELTDSSGLPQTAQQDMQVTVTSSSSAVSVQSPVTIHAGSQWTAVAVNATSPGPTQISAAAQNVGPNQVSTSVFGPAVSQIMLATLPVNLAAATSYPLLAYLSDGTGGIPSQGVTVMQVTTTGGINAPLQMSIPAGALVAASGLSTPTAAGSGSVTVQSGQQLMGNAYITVFKEPAQIGLYIAPSAAMPIKNSAFLAVQLQTESGFPVETTVSMPVTIASSNNTLFHSETMVIPAGGDLAVSYMTLLANGTLTVEASSAGLSQGTATLTVSGASVSVSIIQPAATAGSNIPISARVMLGGTPLAGANVTWSIDHGTIGARSVTNANGIATTSMTPTVNMTDTVSASASTAYGSAATTYQFVSSPTSSQSGPSADVLTRAAVGLVIVVAAVIGFFFYRRRKHRASKAKKVAEAPEATPTATLAAKEEKAPGMARPADELPAQPESDAPPETAIPLPEEGRALIEKPEEKDHASSENDSS